MAKNANILKTDATVRKRGFIKTVKREWPLHVMLIPGLIIALIFCYAPMAGIVMAFQRFNPGLGILGSKWVGTNVFEDLFKRSDFRQVLANTVIIAGLKILFTTILSIAMALLLNEVTSKRFKKLVQTTLFMPYFLSWAILGGIMVEMFSYYGPINRILSMFNIEPIYFIISNDWFRTIIVGTDVWKTIGYQMVVYLAIITNIDLSLYEAARVDGANRLKLCRHITLPGMMPIIVLMAILNIGNILNAGFEQILVMYNSVVYETGDILDTMAYRIGLLGTNDFSTGTALGLFKSVISSVLFGLSYWLAWKFKGYRVF